MAEYQRKGVGSTSTSSCSNPVRSSSVEAVSGEEGSCASYSENNYLDKNIEGNLEGQTYGLLRLL